VTGGPLAGLKPDDAARAEMLTAMPRPFADALFRFFADGEFDDSSVMPTVESLTGRPARTFRDWARAHVRAFDRKMG
jgi:hypothetical protein